MSAAPAQPSYLQYDPQETFEAFQCRQRSAYQAGKQAWRAGLVNGQALQLYDELVRYVGANRFCWVKEETLAAQLGRSESTIKRWMRQLVEVGLISRGRRFGQTSLTFITAYCTDESTEQAEPQEQLLAVSAPPLEASHQGAERLTDTRKELHQANSPTPMLDHPEHAQECQAVPPAACGEPKNEPSISSFLLPHTYKDHHVKIGGGGKNTPTQAPERIEGTATTIRLQDEGVNDPDVLHELQEHPLAEVEQVVRYVARCRSTDDPRRPGLIVHLIRRGFGSRRRRRQHAPADPHTIPREAAPGAEGRRQPSPAPPPIAPDTEIMARWRQALDQLKQQLERQAYETWIAPNQLLVVEDDLAILGTPNIFVRQEVEHHYTAELEAALSQSYGRPMTLQAVIGTAL